jgi:hypothetical protein
MATVEEISEQVDMLSDAYGKVHRDGSLHYDAYFAALSDMDAEFIRRAVVTLLRDKLQYMPTPAEVRAHARYAIDYQRQRESIDEGRRLTCARCQDSGHVWTINRRWLSEHRDQFNEEFFFRGWLRVARRWCKDNFLEDIRVHVVCGCECRNSKIYMQQIARWKDAKQDPSIKASHPAFMNVYQEEYDFILKRTDIEGQNEEDDYRDLLLAFQTADTRTWQGNWTP